MEISLRSVCRTSLGLTLVSPILIILVFSENWSWPESSQLAGVLWFTTLQAGLSALISFAIGLSGAIGLLYWQGSRFQSWLEVLCLLPGFVPPLFVILPVFHVGSWVGKYPLGLFGIVLVHALMNVGLVAVVVARLIYSKMGRMVELAWVEGASRWAILQQGVLVFLRADIALLVFYLFTLCFTSFAIPLMMGGLQGVTLEVLIYEKIRQGGGWSQAFVLSVLQFGLLFLFSLVLSSHPDIQSRDRFQIQYLSWWPGVVLPLLICAFVFLGQLTGIGKGMTQLLETSLLLERLPLLVMRTLLVGLGTGMLVFLLLTLVATLSPHWGLDRFLTGYVSPSPVVTGFACLLLGFYGPWGSHIAMAIGLALLFLPGLYRLAGRSSLQALTRQVHVARVAGASWRLTFWRITFPQVQSSFWWLAGLAAFWACGDFAFSSIVAESSSTLGLLVKAYMTSYHLELASVLNLLLVLVSSTCFLAFGGLAFVAHRKSHL